MTTSEQERIVQKLTAGGSPNLEEYKEVTSAELAELFATLTAPEDMSTWDEAGRENARCQERDVRIAVEANRMGCAVLVALDEDGYWFALQGPRDAIKQAMASVSG